MIRESSYYSGWRLIQTQNWPEYTEEEREESSTLNETSIHHSKAQGTSWTSGLDTASAFMNSLAQDLHKIGFLNIPSNKGKEILSPQPALRAG